MFGKKKEVEIQETQPKEYVPASKTLLGEGITFVGDIDTKDPVEINGRLEGNLNSTSNVFISKSGSMKGDGVMQVMDVEGEVDGDIKCLEVARVAASGKVSGSLATVRLQTEDGSTFDGKLSMIQATRIQPEE